MAFEKKQRGSVLATEEISARGINAQDSGMLSERDAAKLAGVPAAVLRRWYRPVEWHHEISAHGKMQRVYYYDEETVTSADFRLILAFEALRKSFARANGDEKKNIQRLAREAGKNTYWYAAVIANF